MTAFPCLIICNKKIFNSTFPVDFCICMSGLHEQGHSMPVTKPGLFNPSCSGKAALHLRLYQLGVDLNSNVKTGSIVETANLGLKFKPLF